MRVAGHVVAEAQIQTGATRRRTVCILQGQHAFHVPGEMQRSEGLDHLRGVEVGKLHRAQVQLEIQVAHDGSHLARQKGQLAVRPHLLTQLAAQLVGVFVEAFDAAVFLQKLHRRLRAHAGHAGDVVR